MRIVLLALCWGTLSACGLSAADSADTAPSTCERDPPLDWESFGRGFIHQHCTGCHGVQLPEGHRVGAPTAVNLDTYADVLDYADRIQVRTLDIGDMPPGGGPTEEELARLQEWLDCELAQDLAQWEAE